MAKQRFLNNFTSTFIAAVKDAPSSGTPETELDYGVLRISDGAAGSLINPTDGDYYLLTAFKRLGSVESNIEVMRVTGVNNATPGECRITVQRAQEGTSAKAFVAGDYLSLRITKGTAENFSQPADLATKEPVIAAPVSAPTEKYWRGDKTWRDFFTDVRAATLTGLSTATNAVITATDTVLSALGKLQKQVSDNLATLTSHTGNTSNPHGVTKVQVGLGNVDNTSDANKPVSTATQTALDTKVDKVAGKQLSTEDYTTAEKSKLSGVAAGANNYSHPEGDGNQHVPATGTTNNGKVLKAGSTAGSAAWGNVDYSEVTGKPVLGTAASRDVADLLAKMPVNISGATTDFNSLTLSGLYNLYNTQSATGAPPFSYGVMFVIGSNRVGSTFAAQIAIDKATGDTYTRGQNDTSTAWSAWQKAWNSNNDGAGSGLDADLLDGQQGSFYQNASNLTTGTVPEPRLPALPISKITDLQTALNGKQADLGFTPVQQGGPAGYGTNKVYIGWATDGSGLLCQVDATNFRQSWPISITGTATTVVNPYISSAVRQTGDIGAAYGNWGTSATPAVQLDTPNSNSAYMVWRATRWGARHVAAMHVYEGGMTVTMSVGNLNNFIWDGNGNFTATGNVNALSDIRLKTDLTKIEGALEKVCAINGYTYTRKDTGARQTGVVAQEVQKVLPEAVMDNGEHLAVAYGNMVGLLIEAIKELKSEVDQLKGK